MGILEHILNIAVNSFFVLIPSISLQDIHASIIRQIRTIVNAMCLAGLVMGLHHRIHAPKNERMNLAEVCYTSIQGLGRGSRSSRKMGQH